MKFVLSSFFIAVVSISVGVLIGRFIFGETDSQLSSPFIDQLKPKEYPLNAYTFSELRNRHYETRTIQIEEEISDSENFTSYLFTFDPLGRKMTGQLNIPNEVTEDTPVIVMIRGFVPQSIFSTGVGTRNGAAAFANAGFITIAPDFFGYGGSDPEPEEWEARFEKPIVVIELIETIRKNGIPIPDQPNKHVTEQIGLWGHSNGGQISLSVLEIMREPIPTSLWAPVTAPFPYSVLFFSDEDDDEGKGLRLSIAKLEADYELRDFSITRFLDGLRGPIQLHHGSADDAALKVWSDEFIAKVEQENDRREHILETAEEEIDASIDVKDPLLQPIEFEYYEYAGADHNLQPAWNTVVQRDIAFYKNHLAENQSLAE